MRFLGSAAAVFVLVVAVVVGGLVPGASADQAASVSGRVTVAGTGEPLAGVKVELSAYIAEGLTKVVATATTDEDGDFAIYAPPTFSIASLFAPSTDYAPYRLSQNFYPDAGEEIVYNAEFEPSATVSGTVVSRDASGQVTPVAGVDVGVTYLDKFGYFGATTAADGTFTVAQLTAGRYSVRFNDLHNAAAFVPNRWDGKPDEASADTLTLSLGEQRTGIDSTLARGGSISGKIVRADGSVDTNAYALIEVKKGDQWLGILAAGGDLGPDGSYEYLGLVAGTYRVAFVVRDATTGTNTTAGYYQGATTPQDARPLEVELGTTLTGVDGTVPGVAAPVNTTSLDTVDAGATVLVSGIGFVPGSTVTVQLESTPVVLGTLVADEAGSVSGRFVVPASTSAGVHRIVLVDAIGNRYVADFTVTAASAGSAMSGNQLAATGTNAGLWWAPALALVLMGLMLVRRRQVSRG